MSKTEAMNEQEVRQLIQNGESSIVEFKSEDVHPVSLAEEIVAFANFEGGTILVGVEDDGKVAGCKRKGTEEFIINVCRNNVRPALIPVIERILVDDQVIYAVTIGKEESVCSTSKGLFFIRVGSTKQVPTQQELLRLFQRKNLLQFDETPVLKAGIESIDLNKVDSYLTKQGLSLLNQEEQYELINDLLNLSIIVDIDGKYYPALGAMLAFGKRPQHYYPSYTILCGAYGGDDVVSSVLREKELHGSLDELIEDAMAFLKFTVAQDHSLENDTHRKDTFRFPIEALREAVVNGVCHRDYTITGSAVRIFVFKNSVEIHSPGGLPNTLNLETMHYRQFTRNQMVASYLAGYGYMEKRGKGILKMQRLCEAAGITVKFSLFPDQSEFVVKFVDESRSNSQTG